MLIIKIMFLISAFLIFYTFIGYPVSLLLISKFKTADIEYNMEYQPYVSMIIPAHNEEKVIINKLNNLCGLNYPESKLELIVASDNSTDNTNQLVEEFITNNPHWDIKLHLVNERMGKTNAQNEAVRISNGEILVFTDSNAILEKDSISHLVSCFISSEVMYVAGRLKYVNDTNYLSSDSEKSYWNYDLFMRKMESNIKTITAGNGALYAIRKDDYVELDPKRSHDAGIPLEAAFNNKRAVYNEKAIAFEKAGETTEDEFKRKVRMFRGILNTFFKNPKKYNIFKYGWFTYFYFGHRTLRYSLFMLHGICFLTNLLLIKDNLFYSVLFFLQALFYVFALIGKYSGFKSKFFFYPYYYSMTLVAQLLGAINQLRGKSKPFWEKAETTR